MPIPLLATGLALLLAVMALAQAAQDNGGPTENEWKWILGIAAGAIAALWGAYTISQKGRVDELNSRIKTDAERHKDELAAERARSAADLAAERARAEHAERREDAAVERMNTQASIISEQTAALREFGNVVKEVAGESKKYGELLLSFARRFDAIDSTLTDLYRQTGHRPPPASRRHDGD